MLPVMQVNSSSFSLRNRETASFCDFELITSPINPLWHLDKAFLLFSPMPVEQSAAPSKSAVLA
jgi:hypothetical protein